MTQIEYFGLLEGMQGQTMPYELDCLVQEPVPALKYLRSLADLKSLMCPVVQDYLQNVFVITSPLDWTIRRLDDKKFEILNDKKGKPLDGFVQIGGAEPGLLYGQPMIHFNLQYHFITKQPDVIMEVLDVPLVDIRLQNVIGEYNISKWIHPTNFCFFMSKDVDTISFKRGDPLMAVKFRTKDRVRLLEVLDTGRRDKIRDEGQRGMSIKEYYPKIPLPQSFELFTKRMRNLWK